MRTETPSVTMSRLMRTPEETKYIRFQYDRTESTRGFLNASSLPVSNRVYSILKQKKDAKTKNIYFEED